MNTQPVKTVSSLWIHALLLGAEHQGLDRGFLLRQAGVDDETLKQPYARITLEQTMTIWRTAEQLTPHSDFGLLLGEQVKPSHFQLFAVSLMHSETLQAAFEKSIRYTRIVSDGGEYFLDKNEHEARLVYQPGRDDFSRHQIDAVMVLVRSFANWLACKTLPLLRVEVCHPQPDNISNYERIFSVPVIFSAQQNALIFTTDILSEPLALSDEKLAAMHEQMLEQQLTLLQQPNVVIQVEHILKNAPTLALERDDVASQLQISARSLQRKLQESDTSFQQLMEQERLQRGQRLLSQSELPLTAISEQLGFAESSAFSRAFKRWVGQSPLEYRQHSKSAE